MKMAQILCIQCATALLKDEETHVTMASEPAFTPADFPDEPSILICIHWEDRLLPSCRKMQCEACKIDVSVAPSSFWLLGIT